MSTTKTISIGWSDSDGNFGSLISGKDSDKYYSLPISTINSALASNGLNSRTSIYDITLTCRTYFESSASNTSVSCDIGYGGNGSISTYLMSGVQIAKGMKGEKYHTVSLNAAAARNILVTDYGSYITFRIYTGNWGKKSYKVDNVSITVTYFDLYDYTVSASPPEGGIVYDYGGAVYDGAAGKVEAIPNPGYRFLGWYKNGVFDSSELVYYPTIPYNNTVFVAYFELDKILNVYRANTKQDVYRANTNAQVYRGNTKIYG